MRIPGIFVEVRGDYSFLREDLDKAKTIAKAGAADIANSLNGAMDARGVSTNTNALINNISKVQSASKNASVDFEALTKATEGVGKAVGMSDASLASLQARMLQTKAQQEADRAFQSLTKSLGMSRLEAAQFHMQMGDTTGGLKILGGVAKSAAPYILAVGAAATVAAKACFDSALAADRLTKAYTAIEGSGAGAAAQLKFLYDESNRLGLQFQDSAAAAKSFFAAGKGTSLESDLKRIYSGVSEAGTALSLSGDEMNGVFLALGQMMSKGKVQAEELRGQLGERLPGAFTMAAKAMGVTTAELDKMLEQGKVLADDLLPKLADALHDKYGKAATEAADGAAQSVNRMSTEWELFKSRVMDSGPMISAIKSVTNALKGTNEELITRKMQEKGIAGEVTENVYGTRSVEYTARQIAMFKETGARNEEEYNRAIQAQLRANLESGQNAQMDKVLAKAGAATKDYLKDTPDAKRQKIEEEYKAAMDAFRAAREADSEHADRWRAKEAAAEAVYREKLAELGKKGVAAAKKDAREREQVTDAYYSYVGTKTEESLALMEEAENRKHDKLAESIKKQFGATAQGQEMLYNLSVAHSERVEKLYADDEKKRLAEIERITKAEKAAADARRDITEAMQDKMFQATGTDAQKKAYQTEKEIREWREKWEKMGKGSMEEFDAMANHYREVMGQANDETTAAFRKLWDRALERLDDAFAGMWKDFITGSKSAMESLKSMFQTTLAEIAHWAITKPIVVQVGTSLGGSLWGSAAYAGGGGIFSGGGTSGGTTGAGGVATGGAPGSGMNVGSLVSPSWFTPASWASSANSWAASAMPSLFGPTTNISGQFAAYGSAYSSALASGASAEAAAAAANAAATSAQVSLTGTLGAMGIAGGIGMLLGNMLGDKTGGLATGGGSALGAGIGSMIAPGIGTVIGGLLGGLGGIGLSGLFGGGKGPRTASLYTNVQAGWYDDWGAAATREAWGSRGADPAKGQDIYDYIGTESASQRKTVLAAIDAASNAEAMKAALASTSVSFGHGLTAFGSEWEWNKNTDMKAAQEAIAKDITTALWKGVMEAAQKQDWSKEDLTTDFSDVAATQATYTKMAAKAAITDAIDAIISPTDGLTKALDAVGKQFDQYKETLEGLGYGVKTLTELETRRAEVLAKTKAEYIKSFEDDMESRYLALYGTSAEQQQAALRIKHENELSAAALNYGTDSLYYLQLQAMQQMEKDALAANSTQATLNVAQANYVSALQSTYSAMKSFASSVKKLREDLLLDPELSTLGVADRYGTASARLADLTAKALSGDTDAMAELQEVSRAYLEVSKEYNTSFDDYRKDFDRVQSTLQQVESYAATQADDAAKQYEAITGGAIAIVAKLEELKQAFLTAQDAFTTAKTTTKLPTATSVVEGMYSSILGREADTAGLNYWSGQINSGVGISAVKAAIEASPENVVTDLYTSLLGRDARADSAGYNYWTGQLSSGSMSAAEVQAAILASPEYLAKHSHATGGIASGWSIVGEEGPEAVNFTNPARVYTASQTRAALGGDGADLAGELRALRQEVAGMRAENERLLTSVNTNTQKTRDYLEKFDEDGLPAEREA